MPSATSAATRQGEASQGGLCRSDLRGRGRIRLHPPQRGMTWKRGRCPLFLCPDSFAMSTFKLHSEFKPTGDQPEAIRQLVDGVESGAAHQTLLGVTGSGKTFSIANVIERTQRPTLVLSHNKTLASSSTASSRNSSRTTSSSTSSTTTTTTSPRLTSHPAARTSRRTSPSTRRSRSSALGHLCPAERPPGYRRGVHQLHLQHWQPGGIPQERHRSQGRPGGQPQRHPPRLVEASITALAATSAVAPSASTATWSTCSSPIRTTRCASIFRAMKSSESRRLTPSTGPCSTPSSRCASTRPTCSSPARTPAAVHLGDPAGHGEAGRVVQRARAVHRRQAPRGARTTSR